MNTIRSIFFAILMLAIASSTTRAQDTDFTAVIDCAQATTCSVPPCTGSGAGTFTLDAATGMLSYNITHSGLSAAETSAHIHGPAMPGATTGVVVGLPSGTPKIDSVMLTPDQQSELLAGLYYVNIHTGNCPGGEIRGQILPGTSTATSSTTSTSGGITTTTLPAPGICGDLDESGVIGATDALILLQKAVGIDVELKCPACPAGPL